MSTLELIKTLREKTSAGLGACKEALANSNNDIDAAVVYLRKKGLADLAKRAGREIKEGRIAIKTSADGKYTAMVYFGCETDFVAKTADFIALTDKLAQYVLEHPEISDYTNDKTLTEIIHENAPKFGENVSLAKAVCWKAGEGCSIINHYLHTDNKKAALVELSVKCDKCCADTKQKIQDLARTLAMQSVGMVAQYLQEKDVPEDIINREKDIALTQAKNEGKPEAAIAKIIPGRLKKFYKEVCLLDQPFMKDNKISVTDYVASVAKETGAEIKVVRFVRF